MDLDWRALDRRHLIKLGAVGLAALSLPGVARAQQWQGFTHGVASGEPGPNSVLLWTRYAAADDRRLTVEVADAPDFAHVVAGGSVTAMAARDHTAKLVVDGLDAGRWYFYRFIAPDGTASPTGRTRTLPDGPTRDFTIGLFSCSNMPFGWFNAYGHATTRNDIDLAVHIGDYLYEYDNQHYPTPREAVPGRATQPTGELLALADYRLRYAAYRADPDLARLHQMMPMIAQWDDHELANDAWRGGAENHQPDEGVWATRAAAAEQAYREWMPVADSRWRQYQIGDLATLFLPETRATGRDKQFELDDIAAGGGDPATALKRFHDSAYRADDRQMLGVEQERWLFDGLRQSVKSATRWQICASQTVMGSLFNPPEAASWFGDTLPEPIAQRIRTARLAAQAGLPLNMDSWDGYPAARDRLLAAAQRADADLVVLSGDSHNGWAFDLGHDRRAAGIEIGGHSVTSPGFESFTGMVAEDARVAALRGVSPQLKWANTRDRGYVTVQLTPDRVTANWHFVNTIRTRQPTLAATHTMAAARGRRAYDAA